MKAKETQTKMDQKGLSLKEQRAIEQELGIYLGDPCRPVRCLDQQFAVYDEDEQYVGDICANEDEGTGQTIEDEGTAYFIENEGIAYFTDDGLRAAIKKLFE